MQRPTTELEEILKQTTADAAVKGVVITSSKEAFCAGADLSMLEGMNQAYAKLLKEQGEAAANAMLFEQSRRFSLVLLEDPQAHPRNVLRAQLTAELAADDVDVVVRARARGETRLERLVSLVLLGDLVSLYLAVLRGADPVDVGPIDRLKAELAVR